VLAARRARTDKLAFDALQVTAQLPGIRVARLLHLRGNWSINTWVRWLCGAASICFAVPEKRFVMGEASVRGLTVRKTKPYSEALDRIMDEAAKFQAQLARKRPPMITSGGEKGLGHDG
jgi:hypothetical protein